MPGQSGLRFGDSTGMALSFVPAGTPCLLCVVGLDRILIIRTGWGAAGR